MSEFTDYNDKNPLRFVRVIVTASVLLLLFTLIGIPILTSLLTDPEQFIERVKDIQKEKSEKTRWIYDTNDLVKESRDCAELQTAQLDLISKGANANSWFPNINDKSLKIAQERYELIC